MQKAWISVVVCLGAALFFAPMMMAQGTQSQSAENPWKYYPTDVPSGSGGPAPKHDLSGTWNGPGSSDAVPSGERAEKPSMTPLARQIMSERKPIGRYGPAGTNDPNARYCDPLGFPLDLIYQNRAMSIATMPDRIVILHQFGDYWREIWMDGRSLPTNVGGDDKDSLDPTYMGYSVGHWENDDTLVVDTTGLDERTWLLRDGTPHSVNAHVQERYTRVDHNTLKLSMTIDDPKMFTKPFSLGTYYYKWVPNQKINEWLCLPSEQLKYLEEQGDPAGSYPNAAPQRYGGGGGNEGGGRQ
jgi:hypothetical protein